MTHSGDRAVSAGSDIKAITFDVGGTLIEPWPSVGHVYAEVAAQWGAREIPPDLLTSRFVRAWKTVESFNYRREDWAALVDATFLGLIDIVPSRTFFDRLYERFAEPTAWHIYPDVTPTLEALRQRGIRLGVISNWDERLRPLLPALNLETFFEVFGISCEVGAAKPSPRIFEQACRGFGLPANRVLHIGDSLELDVHGAMAAGMRALRICRRAGDEPVSRTLTGLSGLTRWKWRPAEDFIL